MFLMSDKNMELWDSVSKTDTKYLKNGQKNGMSSIDAQYYFMQATKKFGPIGIGWGYEILDQYVTEGQTMKGNLEQKNGPFLDYRVTQMTVKINFWYVLNGERGEFAQYGHTPLVMKTKYGPMMDDDPEKKSLSDAIKKSLTLLGFCADVFLGKFDDRSYIAEIKEEEAIQAEKENNAKKQAINDQINKLVVDADLTYQACATIPAVNGMYKNDVLEINRLCKKINRNPEPPLAALSEKVQLRKESIKNV